MRQLIPQPNWMRTLSVGDVIQERSGVWRIVRDVSRYSDGRLRSVTLVIRRCSWTHRATTTINATDLRVRGFRRLPVRAVRLKTSLDALIAAEVSGASDRAIRCCDVKGLP